LLLVWPLAAQVQLTPGNGQIRIAIGGQEFSTFYFGPETAKPYLHPLRSASGKIVTRHYPMEQVEGESLDHPHHRGLWFTHGDVNGLDFWGNEPTQKGRKGRVVVVGTPSVHSGKQQGSLQAQFLWQDPAAGKTLLKESRTMTFRGDQKTRVVDVDITLTAVEQVKFGDTKEGTFAIRMATPLEEPRPKTTGPARTGKLVNAEGLETEKNVWGKRSAWVDYSGELEGEKLGIAILDHPANPKHPTYWHARSYGLFAANIFGEKEFLRDPSKDGSVTLQPGKSLRFRYRVIIHTGDTKSVDLAGMYRKYAAPKY
jgi:hypothetical protein